MPSCRRQPSSTVSQRMRLVPRLTHVDVAPTDEQAYRGCTLGGNSAIGAYRTLLKGR